MTDGVIANMQRAAHNISYAISRSNAMNGLSANSKIVKVTPLWRWGVYALDGVVTVGAVALIAIATSQILRRRKRDATVAAETGEPAADDGE